MVVVLCTVPNANEGRQIASTLVKEKLCACVNQIPKVTSYYIYEGEFCEDSEELLIIKTLKTSFEELKNRIEELHSYDTVEIVALEVKDVNENYLNWVKGVIYDK